MTTRSDVGRLKLEPQILDATFNREPVGFHHNLHALEIFQLDSLRTLAKKYTGHEGDCMVASGASTPDQKFRAVRAPNLTPAQAMERLKTESVRILLKRPQNYDARFQRLLDELTRQVISRSKELQSDRMLRLESSIFVTSAKTLTPFHFDPSAVFFFQI